MIGFKANGTIRESISTKNNSDLTFGKRTTRVTEMCSDRVKMTDLSSTFRGTIQYNPAINAEADGEKEAEKSLNSCMPAI